MLRSFMEGVNKLRVFLRLASKQCLFSLLDLWVVKFEHEHEQVYFVPRTLIDSTVSIHKMRSI